MKFLFKFTLCSISAIMSFSQNNVAGIYKSHFSEKVVLRGDSSFYYSTRYGQSTLWSKGKWHISNDTIYLKKQFVKDTVRIIGKKSMPVKDTLVLSADTIPNRISIDEFRLSLISSGGQNQNEVDVFKKLLFRNNRLHKINSLGKIDRRRFRRGWRRKKFRTYFKRKEN